MRSTHRFCSGRKRTPCAWALRRGERRCCACATACQEARGGGAHSRVAYRHGKLRPAAEERFHCSGGAACGAAVSMVPKPSGRRGSDEAPPVRVVARRCARWRRRPATCGSTRCLEARARASAPRPAARDALNASDAFATSSFDIASKIAPSSAFARVARACACSTCAPSRQRARARTSLHNDERQCHRPDGTLCARHQSAAPGGAHYARQDLRHDVLEGALLRRVRRGAGGPRHRAARDWRRLRPGRQPLHQLPVPGAQDAADSAGEGDRGARRCSARGAASAQQRTERRPC